MAVLPVHTKVIQYRCRRCGALWKSIRLSHKQADDAMYFHCHETPEKAFHDSGIQARALHRCADDCVGLSDIAGVEPGTTEGE